ncbi:MAG: tetratricopeptide repeat protein [Anaerolineae bacterium]|nr:tetratricopeptide repeat protein [Anaerolineae bacterium]
MDHNRLDYTTHVIEDILTSGQCESIDDLLLCLEKKAITHTLWQQFIQVIAVGETYFFRNRAHIQALRSSILPSIITKRRQEGHLTLRLWSAGCAAGEEPYSLAMLLRELIPDLESWHITLMGTDINLASLANAQRGIFRPSSFRSETPELIQQRWFTPVSGSFELHPMIRNMVTFLPLNLSEDVFPSFSNGTMNMDLIICRNVTIYFDRATAQKVIAQFHETLNHEGWLVVGHSEPAVDLYTGFTAHNLEQAVFYQKEASPLRTFDYVTPVPAAREYVHIEMAPLETAPLFTSAVTQAKFTATTATPNTELSCSKGLLECAKNAADREAWDEALSWLEQAEQEDRLRPDVHYLRALVYMQIKDIEKAIHSLRKAIYCDNDFALAHYSLGELYEQHGQLQLAAKHWKWAETIIAPLDPQYTLISSDDLTVDMLRGLLKFRLAALPD